jgi:RNase P/RNase MRP subunit p29
MKKAKIAIATICLLWTTTATVLMTEAATTFTGAIIGIDQTQRTVTFQTNNGQTWTMPVADSNILKQQIAKGDRVRVDVELSDSDLSQRITKITKVRKDELFESPPSLGAFGP